MTTWLSILIAPFALAAPPAKDTSGSCLSKYKPVYFTSGLPQATKTGYTDGEPRTADIKYQLSFRYKVFGWEKRSSSQPRSYSPVLCATDDRHEIYLTYTQLAIWDLWSRDAPSSPFEELNHNPDLHYVFYPRHSKHSWFSRVKAGFEHESNGEGVPQEYTDATCGTENRFGEGSCSWNRIYIEPKFHFRFGREGNPDDSGLRLYTKVWYILPWQLEENPEIGKELGFYEVTVAFENNLPGSKKGGNPKYTLDATARLKSLTLGFDWSMLQRISRLTPHAYVQWFYGKGETLRTYDTVSSALRLGIRLDQ